MKPRKPLTARDVVKAVIGLAILAVLIAVIVNAAVPKASARAQALSFIANQAPDVNTVASSTNQVIADMKALQSQADAGNAVAMEGQLVTVAADAQQAVTYDGDAWDALASDSGPRVQQVQTASGELQTAMREISNWTDNPSATLTAALESKLASSETDWNAAITQIYNLAGATAPAPPTVTVWG